MNVCFSFQMSCVPALCVPTERPASTEWRSCRLSGGSCSAERRSKPTRAKYTNLITVFFGGFSGFLFHLCDLIQAVSNQNMPFQMAWGYLWLIKQKTCFIIFPLLFVSLFDHTGMFNLKLMTLLILQKLHLITVNKEMKYRNLKLN